MEPITLMPHQQVTHDFMVTHPRSAVFLTPGAGKTLTTLSALMRVQPAGHILVIAPLNIVRSTWIDEIEKWGFPVRNRSLILNDNGKKLSRAKRLERYQEVFDSPPAMWFINQDLIHDLVDQMPMKTIDGKRTRVWPFPTVIIDESQGFKSASSRRFKSMKKVMGAITRLTLLTGTPVPNGLEDLWSQMYLLDGGRALGASMSEYRSRWFTPTRYVDNRPVAYEPLPGAEEEIYSRIQHLAMSVERQGLMVPGGDPIVSDVRLHLDEAERKRYQQFKEDMVLDLADPETGEITITAQNSAVLAAKLVQFGSGTLYLEQEEGKARQHLTMHEHKLEHTEYLLRNIDSPVIIAYRFIADKDELMRYLTDKGYSPRVFDGSREMVAEWNSGSIPIMLLQPASAGHGLNLQDGGHTLIWYTLPWSAEHYEQTNARLNRTGQKHQVIIHRLITAGTYDARSPDKLAGKIQTQDDLIASVRHELAPSA